jgi:cytochrome c oxidase assembly protein subunit 15
MSWQLMIQLGAIALLLGSAPLMYMAYKGNLQNLKQFVWALVFFTFDLILFGAFTRLTDSGLGCPDWPGCYGHSNPLSAMNLIQEAQTQMPFGPVTVSKAWIEMLHRYFASGVGFLILTLTLLAWKKRDVFGKKFFVYSLGLLILVCLQGAFGAFTVTLRLQPLIVSLHLMFALLLIMGLTALTEVTNKGQNIQKPKKYHTWIVILVIVVVLSQTFLGAWVSTNYAVLACRGFPTCNEVWLPGMDFMNGFTWWRELGKTASGEYLSIEALVAIHWTHRLGALITSLTVIGFLFFLAKIKNEGNQVWQEHSTFWGRFIGVVLITQILSGLSNVIFEWPIIAALIHTGGATALLIGLTKLLLLSAQKPALR